MDEAGNFWDNSWDRRGWNRKKERHTYSTVLESRTKLREHCGLVCGWRAEQRRSSSTVHQHPLQLHHQSSLLLTGPVVEVENRQSATIERVRLETGVEMDMETTNYNGRPAGAPHTTSPGMWTVYWHSVYIVISCVLVNICSAVLCGPFPVCTPQLGPFAPIWSAFAAFSLAGGPTPPCTSFPMRPLRLSNFHWGKNENAPSESESESAAAGGK